MDKQLNQLKMNGYIPIVVGRKLLDVGREGDDISLSLLTGTRTEMKWWVWLGVRWEGEDDRGVNGLFSVVSSDNFTVKCPGDTFEGGLSDGEWWKDWHWGEWEDVLQDNELWGTTFRGLEECKREFWWNGFWECDEGPFNNSAISDTSGLPSTISLALMVSGEGVVVWDRGSMMWLGWMGEFHLNYTKGITQYWAIVHNISGTLYYISVRYNRSLWTSVHLQWHKRVS